MRSKEIGDVYAQANVHVACWQWPMSSQYFVLFLMSLLFLQIGSFAYTKVVLKELEEK